MPFGVLVAVYFNEVVAGVVPTVAVALVVWAAIGPHYDCYLKGFHPEAYPWSF